MLKSVRFLKVVYMDSEPQNQNRATPNKQAHDAQKSRSMMLEKRLMLKNAYNAPLERSSRISREALDALGRL